MPDQAAGLRSLFARRRPSLLVVAGSDASKAAVAVHFASEAAAGGRATVLIDGTAGQLASACRISCRYELAHVIAGDKLLGDVVRVITPHLLLLPAARALSRFGSFSADEEARLTDAFSNGIAQALTAAGAQETQDTQVDLIVVHAEEGQAERAVAAFGRDARVILVVSNGAASLRASYGELKALAKAGLEHFQVVVPCFDASDPGSVAFKNLATAARRFLDIELTDGGSIMLTRPGALGVGHRQARSLRGPDDRDAGDADDAHVVSSPPSSFTDEVSHAAAVA